MATLIASLVGVLLATGLAAGLVWAVRRMDRRGEEVRRLGREVVRLEEAVRTAHASTTNLHDRMLVMETRAACEAQGGSNQLSVDNNACNISVRAGPGGVPIGVSVSEPQPTPDFPPDFSGGE
jgi:hypothetical protein